MAEKGHVRHPDRDSQLQEIRAHVLGPEYGLSGSAQVPDLEVCLLTRGGHQVPLKAALTQAAQTPAHLQALRVLHARLFCELLLVFSGILALQLAHVRHLHVDWVELDRRRVTPQFHCKKDKLSQLNSKYPSS